MSSDIARLERFAEAIVRVRDQIARVIVGQERVVEQLLVALFARGHCLIIGVPGLAKTLLIRTLARVLALRFSRIQFTPDLMPSDITGTEVLEENLTTGEKRFRFVRGPIFANIVLADEINRTPPKTQSALLEAMQEYSVTAAGVTYRLEEPFFVLATQNPIEQEGTYPLPEAQLDRFMFNLWIDYPSFEEEVEIVQRTTVDIEPVVEEVLTAADIIEYQHLIRRIPVADHVVEYAVRLVRATRPQNGVLPMVREYLRYGAGPRASQYLILGAKARAALYGRYTPSVEDVRAVSLPVLRHRLVLNFAAEADNVTPMMLVERLLSTVE
ncbi:MAG: MoxR family ATPase [Candidatus Kapabacteria bacterium]|nr:MoxR family ATPase [Candidatus Kapabacteria bacterium]MDW8226051.1 MoxR family ATPase [Bacteroidota bacterium]